MITNINKKKIRKSRQREIIREIAIASREHPTADQIYHQARKKIPNISLGTVYRNLNLLVQTGEIRSLLLDDTSVHYDGNPEAHLHFVCTECGKIYDIFLNPGQIQMDFQIEHQINEIRIELYGVCINCKNNKED